MPAAAPAPTADISEALRQLEEYDPAHDLAARNRDRTLEHPTDWITQAAGSLSHLDDTLESDIYHSLKAAVTAPIRAERSTPNPLKVPKDFRPKFVGGVSLSDDRKIGPQSSKLPEKRNAMETR
jgi:hypothetical protein